MEKGMHEIHHLEQRELPIIFRHMVVQTGGVEVANWHNNIEIIYCNVGSGQVLCNSVEYDVEEGDIIIVNSNQMHFVRKTKKFEYYYLIIDSNFLSSNGISPNEIEFETFVRSEAVKSLFGQLIKEFHSQSIYYAASLRALLLNLVVFLAREHSAPCSSTRKNSNASDERIKRSIEYIQSNYFRKFSLEELANEVGLTKCYFARAFKRATGMTVVTYINVIRCHSAEKMLMSRKYSVSEVAEACGFENNSYFSKTFRSVVGCPPSKINGSFDS